MNRDDRRRIGGDRVDLGHDDDMGTPPAGRATVVPPRPIRDLELEFLRAGPAHNQLLSPLTPYIALCGADGPASVHFPFEHAQLLTRLNRLRYAIDGVAVPAGQRGAELRELGEVIARLLATIPGLVSALHAARADTGRLVNLRLRLSAFELGLVPFETTLAPGETADTGAPLLLSTLTEMTREIRRGEPLALNWNRAPRILFAFASASDLPEVPAQAHVDALRRAIDPWVGIKDSAAERLTDVRRMLTVLKNASAARISAACRAGDYSHVHILAHGAPLPGSDHRRFGLCLAADEDDGDDDDPGSAGQVADDDGAQTDRHGSSRRGGKHAVASEPHAGGRRTEPRGSRRHVVVDGQSLALALTGSGRDGGAKRPPTVVTLATCDSGHIGNVLTPGGSIAHELHAADVPWVIAAQFPLWMQASSLCAEVLYAGLLAGKDPRWVMHEVRQRLRIELPGTHDWASLVAYAAIAPDLPAQVDAFRSRQTRTRLDLKFERMDALVAADAQPGCDEDSAVTQVAVPQQAAQREPAAVAAELAALCATVRADLAAWCNEATADRDPRERAARLAMRAASEKRIAIVYGLWASRGSAGSHGHAVRAAGAFSTEAYRLARHHYRAALKAEPANHWAITQYLSISVTPALASSDAALATTAARHRRWWQTARQLAEWDASGSTGRARAWAQSTIAELELLGAVYAPAERATEEARLDAVVAVCRQLCEGADDDGDVFPVAATLRQFRRYLDHWPRPEWRALAQAAIDVLAGSDCGCG